MSYDRDSRNDIPERGNTVLDLSKEAANQATEGRTAAQPVLFTISLPSFQRSYIGGEKDGTTETQTPRAEITAAGIALHDLDLYTQHIPDLLNRAVAILPDILHREAERQHAQENRVEIARETLMNAVMYGEEDEVDHAGDAIRDLADWLGNRAQDQDPDFEDIDTGSAETIRTATLDEIRAMKDRGELRECDCDKCTADRTDALSRPHRTPDGYWAAGGVKYQDYQQAKAVMKGIVAGDPSGSCQVGGTSQTWDGDEGTRICGPGLMFTALGHNADVLNKAWSQTFQTNKSTLIRAEYLHGQGVVFSIVDEAPAAEPQKDNPADSLLIQAKFFAKRDGVALIEHDAGRDTFSVHDANLFEPIQFWGVALCKDQDGPAISSMKTRLFAKLKGSASGSFVDRTGQPWLCK